MRVSQDRLRAYVLTRDDMDLINSGKAEKVDARKISQRLLAEKAGVTSGFINHLTAGRRRSCTPEVAERIAEALEIPVRALFDPEISSNTRGVALQRKSSIAKSSTVEATRGRAA